MYTWNLQNVIQQCYHNFQKLKEKEKTQAFLIYKLDLDINKHWPSDGGLSWSRDLHYEQRWWQVKRKRSHHDRLHHFPRMSRLCTEMTQQGCGCRLRVTGLQEASTLQWECPSVEPLWGDLQKIGSLPASVDQNALDHRSIYLAIAQYPQGKDSLTGAQILSSVLTHPHRLAELRRDLQ